MSHNINYHLSHSLTFIEKNYRVYNWLNGEYIEFEDIKHPFLNIISSNAINFKILIMIFLGY